MTIIKLWTVFSDILKNGCIFWTFLRVIGWVIFLSDLANPFTGRVTFICDITLLSNCLIMILSKWTNSKLCYRRDIINCCPLHQKGGRTILGVQKNNFYFWYLQIATSKEFLVTSFISRHFAYSRHSTKCRSLRRIKKPFIGEWKGFTVRGK